MRKILNIIMFLLIMVFSFYVYNHYSSTNNIKKTSLNRVNIEEILKNKITDLPLLANDTNNAIVFNDSFNDEIKKNKPRKFWDLLKKDE